MCENELTTLIICCQHGDAASLFIVWNEVQPIIVNTAASFTKKSKNAGGYTFDDLYQESYFTLVKAVKAINPDTDNCFRSLFKTALINDFIRLTGCCTHELPKVLNCAVSLDAPLTDSENSGILRDVIPDGNDDLDDVIHRIWLEDLRHALEQALRSIPEEQAAALWRRCQGEHLSSQEQRLAHIALNKLKRKQSTYRYLQRFVCSLV